MLGTGRRTPPGPHRAGPLPPAGRGGFVRRFGIVCSAVVVALFVCATSCPAGPLAAEPGKILEGVSTRALAMTQDNLEAYDLSHVDDRDRIRREARRSMLRFANRFATSFDVTACRRNLERMYEGEALDEIPASILERLASLEPVADVERVPLTEEDTKRIEKIKVAFVVDRLLAYGAPGKRPIWDRDGPLHGAFAAFLGAYDGDGDYLKRIRDYEAKSDRLFIFKVSGTTGREPPTPPSLFRANMGARLDALLAEPVNGAGARGMVGELVDAVIDRHCGNLDRSWTLKRDWWDLAKARPETRSEAEHYAVVSGGQFFARRADAVAASLDDTEALVEAVSTVPSFTALVDGDWYPPGTVPTGSWRGDPEASSYEGAPCMALVYDWPGRPAPVPQGTPGAVPVLNMLLVRVDPIPYEIEDRSALVSGAVPPGTAPPRYKVSDRLRAIAAMLSVVDEPPRDLPETLPDFDGSGGGGPTRYVRSRPIGTPF